MDNQVLGDIWRRYEFAIVLVLVVLVWAVSVKHA